MQSQFNHLPKFPKSVFAESPIEGVSAKYSFISSAEIVERFLSSGFEIHRYGGVNPRNNGGPHARHFLTFANKSIPNLVDPRDPNYGGIPEVLLTNSSDGKSAVQFSVGVFAVICSNGLVVGTEYARKRFKHMNLTELDVDNLISEFINSPHKIQDDINRYANHTLTSQDMHLIACEALVLKYGSVKGDPNSLLTRRREQDKGDDAWTIYNVIQENLTQGGYKLEQRIVRRMQSHRANPLTQKLWDLFEARFFS